MLALARAPFKLRQTARAAIIVVLLTAVMMLVTEGTFGPSGSLPTLSVVTGLPLSFEPNVGQVAAPAQFLVRQSNSSIFFTPSEVVLALAPGNPDRKARTTLGTLSSGDLDQSSRSPSTQLTTLTTLRMTFVDADSGSAINPSQRLPGKANYLKGNDPSAWHTNIPTYAGITYSGLYPGIDLSYSGSGGHLKGTYYLASGADPSLVRWRYDGAQNTTIDNDGNLVITLDTRSTSSKIRNPKPQIIEVAPTAWQQIDGNHVPVNSAYQLAKDGTIAFRLGKYDHTEPLIIDPTLVYSSYLGGYYEDGAREIQLDSEGNLYITGYSFSPDYPTTPGSYQWSLGSAFAEDAFVTKLTPDGSAIIYSTFIGGTFSERAEALAVDSEGNAYITGWTSSNDYPVYHAFQPTCQCTPEDGFVSKLNHDGSALVYSTFLGGQAGDDGFAIAVSGAGNAYVTGRTSAPDFPVTANAYQPELDCSNSCGADAFVTEFTTDGTGLVYSTYLGGDFAPGRVGNELGFGIAVDAAGRIYAIGVTTSADFPVTSNAYQTFWGGNDDAFISKFDVSLAPQQQLLYSTYFGGVFFDDGFGITVSDPDIIYVTGHTDSSSGFPITSGAVQQTIGGGLDAFASKLDTNQSGSASLLYSTYLGGSSDDIMGNIIPALTSNIVPDLSGNAYLSGRTFSTDFPIADPIQPTNHGVEDVFVTALNPSASALVFSTYLGGTDDENGNALTIDAVGNIFLAGSTQSTDFPVANPLQPSSAGDIDAFVARVFNNLFTPVPTYTPIPTSTGTAPTATPTICTPQNNYSVRMETGATLVPGTTDIGMHCDDCVTSLPLPFPVTLYDQTATSINVSANGNLQFLSADPGPGTDSCFPQPSFNYVIVPFLADLNVTNGGIYTSLDGVAPFRIFTIEWRGCQYNPSNYQCTIPIDLEVRLYENSPERQIDFIYDQVSDYGVVGIQKGTGQLYKLYNCFSTGNLYQGVKVTLLLPTCSTPFPTSTGTPPTGTPTATPTFTPSATPTQDTCHNPGTWQPEPTMTTARAKVAGAVANGKLYVISGQNDDPESPQEVVEAYDPATNAWATVSPIPVAAREAGAASVGGKIYVAGGLSTSFAVLTNMQIYDTVTGAWSQGAPLPAPRAGSAVVTYNDKVYIIGGEQSSSIYQTNTMWEYDPTTNGYTTRAPMPIPSTDLKAAAVGSLIYVLGGDETFFHYVYNPATNTWSTIAPPPVPNFSLPAIFVLNDEIWLLAGGFSYERPYPLSQEVLIYSPAHNTWRYGPLLNTPRFYGPAAGTIGDRGYLVGGVDASIPGGPDFNYLSSMESIAYLPCGTPAATATATSTPISTSTSTATATSHSTSSPVATGTVEPTSTLAPSATSTGEPGTPSPIVTTTSPPGATLTPTATPPTTFTMTVPTSTPTNCTIQFTDVTEDNTFYPSIICLACGGIIDGYTSGCETGNPCFKPGNNVTRGQISKIVSNAAGFNDTPTGQTFQDVPPGSTFYDYIERLAARDVMQGYPCGDPIEPCIGPDNRPYFRPNGTATRGQISKIVSNAAGFNDTSTGQAFQDVPLNSTFYDYIERLSSRGIINGYPCGGPGEPCIGPDNRPYFRTGALTTRGQASKIVALAFFPECGTS